MGAEVIVSVVGTLGVIVVGYLTYKGNVTVAAVRQENSSQHGNSQSVIRDLTAEVRDTRISVDHLTVMARASSEEVRVRHRIQLAFSDDAWYETDAEGSCVWVNQAWCALAQCTIEDAMGFGWGNFMHPDDAADVFADWNYAVGHGREFGPKSFRFKSGWAVQGRALPMFGLDGKVTGYVGQAQLLSKDLQKISSNEPS